MEETLIIVKKFKKIFNVLHLTFYIRYVYVKLIMKSKMTPYDYRKIIMIMYILVNLINVFERNINRMVGDIGRVMIGQKQGQNGK